MRKQKFETPALRPLESESKQFGRACPHSLPGDPNLRPQAERERERLYAIAAAANAAQDLDEILKLVREAVIEVEGFDRAGVWLIDNGILRGTWGTDEQGRLRDEHDQQRLPAQIHPLHRPVVRGAAPYVLVKAGEPTDPRLAQITGPLDFAMVGLRARGEMVGLLCLDNLLTCRPIMEEEIHRMAPFAEQAAIAIYNARLLAERERHLDRQRRLAHLGAAICARANLNDILRMVRDAVVEVGGFDRAGVSLYDRERDMLCGTWGTDREGNPENNFHHEYPVAGRGPTATVRVIRGEQPYVIVPDATTEFGIPPGHWMHGVHAHAVVPLNVGAQIVGIISVDNLLRDTPISAADVEGLLPFAEQAAIAIYNARLQEERARYLERQQHLARMATAISASADLNEIFLMVRDAAIDLGGFDRACVFLYDREQNLMRGTWGTDRAGQLREMYGMDFPVLPDDQIPMARVIRNELKYTLTADLTAEYHLPPDHPLYGIRAQAVIPMRAGGVVVGMVCVDNSLRDRRITREDVEGLLPFAEQAAVAIQNARLFEELRQAQDALVHSEKLRAIGELASGVAHNVNNILAGILSSAELIQETPGVPAEVCHYARIIERSVLDGAEIVKRVQRFARQENEACSTVFDLAAVVQEAIDLTRPAWLNQATGRGVKIAVVTEFSGELYALGVDYEIREVLVNLIRNGVDAMPDGGTLTVRCYAERGQSVVSVTDTGIGMDESTRKRVFHPFFTTKGVGLGTGLGLSVALGIMDRHNGRIEVQSAPGEGATFTMRLPKAEARNMEAPAAASVTTLDGTRLLLVEDEELVAAGMARALTSRGARVEFSSNADEALEWLELHAAQCDMVISDHGMVGMTGMEFLNRVRDLYPQVRRVLLSGWGANLPNAVDTSAAELILTKPVRLEELASALVRLKNGG